VRNTRIGSTGAAHRLRPLRRHAGKGSRESARRVLSLRIRALATSAGLAIAAPAALTTRGVLPRSAALAAIPAVGPGGRAVLARIAPTLRGHGRRGFRSAAAVHRDALDGETLGFETFAQHAEVRLKQDPCLGGGGREVGNNCPVADHEFDAEGAERRRLEAHGDGAAALVCEETDTLCGKLRRRMGLAVARRGEVGGGTREGGSCVGRAKDTLSGAA